MIERRITYEQFKEEPKRAYLNGYTVQENVILQYREAGQKYSLRIESYPWYFCVTKEDFEKNASTFKRIESKIQKIEEDLPYFKIYCRNANKKVMDEKHQVLLELDEQHIKHYEGDVSSLWRCMIDNDIKIETEYRVLYIDIETDDRGKGISVGRDSILSIGCVDATMKAKYFSYKLGSQDGERNMLKRFLEYIDDYDILATWNGEKFDIPYIQERLHKYDIFFNWRQTIHIDMMQKTMELNKRNMEMVKAVRGFSLNAISKYVLNETKVELSMGIYEMFEKDPEMLKKYNIQDVVLLVKLEGKLNIIKQKIVEHGVTGNFLYEYAVSRLLDVYFLRNAKKFGNVRFKTRPARSQEIFDEEDKYAGGYVMEPVLGLHEKVYHFDFTSLYPSIIQTFNISPETFVRKLEFEVKDEKYIHTPNKCLYEREQGIIPILVADLVKARDDIRKVEMKKYKEGTPEYESLYFKQYSFKTIANSFYGILGAKFTRYYLLENAEAITLTGQYLAKLSMDWFTSEGHQPLYSDTDSVFAKITREIDVKEIYNEVNLFLDYHLFKHFKITYSKIDLKIEDILDKFLLVDKKKYVKLKDGKLKITGIEARRRETLPLTARAQEELLAMTVKETKPVEEIKAWLEGIRKKVYTDMTPEDLILQTRLSKDVDDYDKEIKDDSGAVIGKKEAKQPWVIVARWLKENGVKEHGQNTWEQSAYVKFIVTEGFNKLNAVSPLNYDGKYDADYYWSVKIYAPIKRLLIVIFPDTDWDAYDVDNKAIKKQRKLDQKQLQLI